MTSPTVADACAGRRLRAISFRWKPSASIACLTRAVAKPTPGSPFTTRDTVLRLTPAACATSRIVGREERSRLEGGEDNVVIDGGK